MSKDGLAIESGYLVADMRRTERAQQSNIAYFQGAPGYHERAVRNMRAQRTNGGESDADVAERESIERAINMILSCRS